MPWWPHAKRAYTAFTRRWSPVSRVVAHVTPAGGPRSVARTAEDAVAAAGPGAACWTIREPEVLQQSYPRGIPPRHPAIEANLRTPVPRVAVALLPGGRVVGKRHGAVLTGEHALAYEFSPYFAVREPAAHPVWLRPVLRKPVDLPGTVAVLATRGDANYYHFLLDCLPRIAILRESPAWQDDLRFYVPCQPGYQRDLLGYCGIGPDRVVDSRQVPHLRAQRLLVPGLPTSELHVPGWAVEWLRATLLPAAASLSPGPRRLLISRGGKPNTRRVVNEAALAQSLAPHGFVLLDPGAMPVAEQIALFAGAEMIVAPHGAALANLVFVAPGTRVVELFAPSYVNTCYWELSQRLGGVDYRYLLGYGTAGRHEGLGVSDDVVVDPTQVLELLELG